MGTGGEQTLQLAQFLWIFITWISSPGLRGCCLRHHGALGMGRKGARDKSLPRLAARGVAPAPVLEPGHCCHAGGFCPLIQNHGAAFKISVQSTESPWLGPGTTGQVLGNQALAAPAELLLGKGRLWSAQDGRCPRRVVPEASSTQSFVLGAVHGQCPVLWAVHSRCVVPGNVPGVCCQSCVSMAPGALHPWCAMPEAVCSWCVVPGNVHP